MNNQEYLKMPWSVEDTIENLKEIKGMMIAKVKEVNLHGKAESDAREVAFDFDRAIKALEEIQPYWELGTVEEIKELIAEWVRYREHGTVRQIEDFIADWRKFRELGNLEELREAMEKQVPYKPEKYPMSNIFSYCGKCKCGAVFLDKNTRYCGNCGQAIDWGEGVILRKGGTNETE